MSDKVDCTEEKWREAVRICECILSDRAGFENEEISYKLEISERVKSLFNALEEGEDFVPRLKRAFSPPNNLIIHYAHSPFTEWAAENPEHVRSALLGLVDTSSSVADRIDCFLASVPDDNPSGPGTRLSIASFFLMGLRPANHPMYRTRDYRTTERLLGWPDFPSGYSLGKTYTHHRGFAQKLLARLQEANLDARDMLDAQSLIWMLANKNDPDIRAWRGEAEVPTALERAMDEFENELDEGWS